jgi:hypothetical protein
MAAAVGHEQAGPRGMEEVVMEDDQWQRRKASTAPPATNALPQCRVGTTSSDVGEKYVRRRRLGCLYGLDRPIKIASARKKTVRTHVEEHFLFVLVAICERNAVGRVATHQKLDDSLLTRLATWHPILALDPEPNWVLRGLV